MIIFLIIFVFLLSRDYSNYHIIPVLPLVCLLASSIFDRTNNISNYTKFIMVILSCLGLFINNISEQIKINYSPHNKTIILSNFLKKIIKKEDTVFSLDNGIYLLLDKKYPTKIIHPSLLFQHYILSAYFNDVNHHTNKELNDILSKKPTYIVMLDKWEKSLPELVFIRISRDYKLMTFIDPESKSNLKKVNKEYLNTVKLYKIVK